MARIEFKSDKNRGIQETEGSDGRLNVSSRSDGRRYYNSRDDKQTYTAVFDHQTAVAGEYSMYIKNTSNTKELVISSIGINTANASRIKLWFVTGDAVNGAIMTPSNANKGSSNDSSSLARQGNAGSGITGINEDGIIDFVAVSAGGHEEFRLDDTIRLGQNDAIALEYDEGADGDFFGVAFMYFEDKLK